VGGGIYDAMLAHCAIKAKADAIYTWNARHYNPIITFNALRLIATFSGAISSGLFYQFPLAAILCVQAQKDTSGIEYNTG
jgi:hypothetical protein